MDGQNIKAHRFRATGLTLLGRWFRSWRCHAAFFCCTFSSSWIRALSEASWREQEDLDRAMGCNSQSATADTYYDSGSSLGTRQCLHISDGTLFTSAPLGVWLFLKHISTDGVACPAVPLLLSDGGEVQASRSCALTVRPRVVLNINIHATPGFKIKIALSTRGIFIIIYSRIITFFCCIFYNMLLQLTLYTALNKYKCQYNQEIPIHGRACVYHQ